MLKINEVEMGKSYACRFKTQTILDEKGLPVTPLSSNTIKGPGVYESLGILTQRDLTNNLVKLVDEPTKIEFVVPIDDIWDIDEIEWVEPLGS